MIAAGLLHPITIAIVPCLSKKSNGESSDNWKYNDASNRIYKIGNQNRNQSEDVWTN